MKFKLSGKKEWYLAVLIIVVGNLLGMGMAAVEKRSAKTDYLERNPYGEGAYEETLQVELEGKQEEIQIYVEEQKYTEADKKRYLKEAEKKAEQDYQKVQEQNRAYRRLLKEERFEEAEELFESLRPLEQKQLANFKKEQDTFVRIDWYGNVLYPHEILLKNIRLLEDAIEDLEKAEVSKALGRLYQVDNNAYAFMFDEDVYNHFTDYVFHQPRERLKWGYGRIMEHEKLYTLVRSLLEKEKTAGSDFESEILRLKKVCEKQYTLLEKYTDKITEVLKETYLN